MMHGGPGMAWQQGIKNNSITKEEPHVSYMYVLVPVEDEGCG